MKIFDCPRCGERRDNSGMLGNTGVCLICAETELIRLREMENALKGVTDLPLAQPWRVLASILREEQLRAWANIIDTIANVLEPV